MTNLEHREIEIMTDTNDSLELSEMALQIVAAYALKHDVQDLSVLMRQVQDSMNDLNAMQAHKRTTRFSPAVPIEKSIHPDFLICLEDGKCLKLLKRHLRDTYDMTPDQYRKRWNLPADYPMVAPNYAIRRQDIARAIGLSRYPKSKRNAAV